MRVHEDDDGEDDDGEDDDDSEDGESEDDDNEDDCVDDTWVLKGSVIEKKTPIFFVDAKLSQIAQGFQKCKS